MSKGCDAPTPSIYFMLDGTIGCRCMICARCGKHTGNSHQGHWWGYCKVTRKIEAMHMCCPDDCELNK